MHILGIETSCDETAIALLEHQKVKVNLISSQHFHTKYGGIVPELASRSHQVRILPLLEEALKKAQWKIHQIDLIGVTQGPGLIGALMVGVSVAKSLGLALNIPVVAVDHIEAHQLSVLLNENKPDFPYLCLTVSGGHTLLTIVHNPTRFEVLGKTLDDAAGEAFDKGAKILGLGYPGGPAIDRLAQKGNPYAFSFPKAKVKSFHFSYSGLKTALLYFVRERETAWIEEHLSDICASYQHAIVSSLLEKLWEAVEKTKIKQVAVVGGVSANRYLRTQLLEQAKQKKVEAFLVPKAYCTDNAAMIGFTAYLQFQQGKRTPLNFEPYAKLW